MNSIKEGFELLDSLGISQEVQQLFSAGLREDASGKLIADYRDEKGRVVDQEILAVSMQKMSSCGILHFSPALPENVRTLYISDAIMHLIFMVQRKIGRIDFSYAAFLMAGAKMDRELIVKGMDQFPEGVKIYTLFGHSLIGRIRDCKVQHWLKGQDCRFRLDGNKVVASFQRNQFRMAVEKFSLRNHLRQVRVRQTVATLKPIVKENHNFGYL